MALASKYIRLELVDDTTVLGGGEVNIYSEFVPHLYDNRR